jgi:mRNA interferase RelE/StbE
MTVEFDKSFEKWLSKINDKALLRRIEKVILKMESAESIDQIQNVRKLTGFKRYYRVKLGNHRMGFERTSKSVIRLIIVADRKEIYRKFPK